MSSPPALANGPYQALFFWGVLGLSIIITAFLFVCTPLGHPLKRRLLRTGLKDTEKSGQFNAAELEAHTLEFHSPPIGTPAPPYEWVLRITPPPPPHFPSAVAHVAPTLTHRFSDIPRVPSGNGLGIDIKEDYVVEKRIIEAHEKTADTLHDGNISPVCTEPNHRVLLSKPAHISPGRRLSVVEIGNAATPEATGEAEREARQDRYRAILLQSDERTRQKLLMSMPEEDRMISLAL